MHTKLIITVVIALLASWGLGYYASSHIKEFDVANSSERRAIRIGPGVDIMSKIDEATRLLQSSSPLQEERDRKQIELALLNVTSGDIIEKRFWFDDTNAKAQGSLILDPIPGTTADINVQVKWWNSFNSFYEVPDRPELVVIANKYPIESKYLGKLPERQKSAYTDIIYVPYSTALQIPQIIKQGKNYIETTVAKAYGQLEHNKVTSRYAANALVSKQIPQELVKSIMLIEHIDPKEFMVADDNGVDLVERVLTIIGANKDRAFRYTGSPAGASGLAQFITPTYNAMVAQYPGAHLIKDYGLGMADHVNATQAMVLFFDSHSQAIAQGINTGKGAVGKELGISEEMLAAAYNGGPGRVVSSIKKYGLAWISQQLSMGATQTIFRQETIDYIKKFQSIRQILADQ